MQTLTTAHLGRTLEAIMSMISAVASMFGTDEKTIIEILAEVNDFRLKEKQHLKMN